MIYRCADCTEKFLSLYKGKCPACGGECMLLSAIKLRSEKRGNHVHVTVFMGKDAQHLANCGMLIMCESELQLLSKALQCGSDQGEFELLETLEVK
jgi:DNA-directed RNA polymerase subunit RPC12/RpoP